MTTSRSPGRKVGLIEEPVTSTLRNERHRITTTRVMPATAVSRPAHCRLIALPRIAQPARRRTCPPAVDGPGGAGPRWGPAHGWVLRTRRWVR